MAESIKYEIIQTIGVLSQKASGWSKELNLISWNDGRPKYDIRDWSPDHKKMREGVSLTKKELAALAELIQKKPRRAAKKATEKPLTSTIRKDEHSEKVVTMKALSIHAPYAMAIVTGEKTVECRSWKTDYRGDILICSSSKKYKGTIPGHALGVVTLKDIVPFQAQHLRGAMMDDYYPDDYAWILTNPRLIKPFPVKGKLHLWPCEHEIEFLPVAKNEQEDEELGRIYWDPIIYNG